MIKNFSSFRDPSGFVYEQNGNIFRQVNNIYKTNYDFLLSSGLYAKLVEKNFLLPIEETPTPEPNAYKTLKIEKLPFISYPYEWCFDEFKDAALLTLKIQKQALLHKMCLKDASAYNVQFKNGKPIFIDTLSFEKLNENKPWIAYKQFCQHFLAPLALMSFTDINLNTLMINYIDGIPLDLASTLLPKLTSLGIFSHIKLNNYFQQNRYHSNKSLNNMTLKKHLLLVESLFDTIKQLKLKTKKTLWQDYYNFTNYDSEAFSHKKEIIKNISQQINNLKLVYDLGANDGTFSHIIAKDNVQVLSFDIDPIAVNNNYLYNKQNNHSNILPLLLDLTNPSPAIGWANKERLNLMSRALPDMIMALALIHHLAIGNNIPFEYIASYFSQIAPYLIIEFVPKNDSQVQSMLYTRSDIYSWYTQVNFEKTFLKHYDIMQSVSIKNSQRTIYLMKRKRK